MRNIYYNGRVYTGELPLCSAFAVEDGRFTAVVGDEDALGPPGRATGAISAGALSAPGFNDSHMHLLNFGQSLAAAQLAPHTGSLAGMLDYLREFLAAHPPREGQWLTGRGWNQDYFTDVSRMPDRWDLDAVSAEIPILITRACGHCCVVNSRVLALAGITADTPSPEGGSIGMTDGQPDGRLYDNAIELLEGVLPLPGKEELKQMIRLACQNLNRFGVTSSQTDDYCVFRAIPFETVNAAYRELEESGELTVRVYEQANFTELPELKRFVEAGNVTGAGTDLFRIGPLKMLGDGALGSRTAHLSRPYADDPDNCGFSLFTPEHMKEMVSYANAHGMQVAIHAIGDACLDQVLDAVELALREHPRADHRHGVVHCQASRPDQLERIRAAEHARLRPVHLPRLRQPHRGQGPDAGARRQQLQLEDPDAKGRLRLQRLRLPGGAAGRDGGHPVRRDPLLAGRHRPLPARGGLHGAGGSGQLHHPQRGGQL